MFLVVPTGSDAPLRHWPIATGVTIAATIAVGIVQCLVPDFTDTWLLKFGHPNPLTWLTAAYLHGDIGHLLGNMTFLFLFGMIVEGKVGWWRFLLIYNSCAVLSGILISLATILMTEGGCLGASCAIFSLMVICFLWAPENEVTFWGVLVIILKPFTFTFDMTLQQICFCFVALNLAIAGFTQFTVSSELLHLIGTLPGIVIGFGMLYLRKVNCDGHDFISIRTGKRGQSQLTAQELAEEEKQKEERLQARRDQLRVGREKVQFHADNGHYEMAIRRFESLRNVKPGIVMDEAVMVKNNQWAGERSRKSGPVPADAAWLLATLRPIEIARDTKTGQVDS